MIKLIFFPFSIPHFINFTHTNTQKASMRSSTRSESNGNPVSDNLNNNSNNDVEKVETTPPSSTTTPAATIILPPQTTTHLSTTNNRASAEDVIDISSSPLECNNKLINQQPATNDNELIQRAAEPVENSEKKVNVYEQVSTLHVYEGVKH